MVSLVLFCSKTIPAPVTPLEEADKLLIKPTAGARPASPYTLGRFIRKARNNA